MRAGFIGAGKVGFSLGKYLRERGCSVSGYYSRNPISAAEAALFTKTETFASPAQILSASDILFLTVPDGEIKNVWDELKTLPIEGKIICHCSGALSSEVFNEISQSSAFGYSVHPLLAVHSKTSSYKEMSQAVFTVEGDKRQMSEVTALIEKLGNPVSIIESHQKTKYHAAAVFLSNHVNAVAYTGCKLLGECGLDAEFSQAALKTLFLSQCKATAELGPINALTGPAERNDLHTVEKHLDNLGKNEAALYSLLTARLIEMSKIRHPDRNYTELENIL